MKYISVYADKLKRERMDLIYPLSSAAPEPPVPPESRTSEFTLVIPADALTQTIYFTQSAAKAVTVDWGDDSASVKSSDLAVSLSHTYASAGNYTVKLKVAEDATVTLTATIETTIYTFAKVNDLTTEDYRLHSAVIRSGTILDQSNFRLYKGLESLVINNSIEIVPNNLCADCSGLLIVVLHASVTEIQSSAFIRCSSLPDIVIPENVSTIAGRVFSSCVALTSITSLNTTPPTISSNTFGSVPADCNIYVPSGSVADYKAASYWSARADYIQAII